MTQQLERPAVAVPSARPATARKASLAKPVRRSILWIAAIGMVALYAAPFIYLVLTSFKTPADAISTDPAFWPRDWTWDNYAEALATSGVVASFGNSLATALLSTALTLVLAIPASYAVSRYVAVSGQVFLVGILITRMIPPIAIGIPLFGIIASLGLLDTVFGLAIAHTVIALPLCVWLMASFFEGLPSELVEAAQVDGLGRFGAFARVVLPVVSGGVAVTALFAFLASWNDFLFALLLTSVNAQTTPIAISNFQTTFSLEWGQMTALGTLYSLPMVLVTLLLQRQIVAGMTLGAVKG